MFWKSKKKKDTTSLIYSLSIEDLKNNPNLLEIGLNYLDEIKEIVSITTYDNLNYLVIYNSISDTTISIITPKILDESNLNKYIKILLNPNWSDLKNLDELFPLKESEFELIKMNLLKGAELMKFRSQVMKEYLGSKW